MGFKDITGQRFGRLVVLNKTSHNKNGQNKWLCKCDCGETIEAITTNLIKGKTKSCGCLFLEGNAKKHGMSNSRINGIYRRMKQRCINTNNPRFLRYGGRGIKVCDEWLGENGFSNFYNWSMKNGYSEELTIDRIDNDGNYEPSNCRWVTNEVQVNNTSRNMYITHNGITHSLSVWCKLLNLHYPKIYQRIYKLKYEPEYAIWGWKK